VASVAERHESLVAAFEAFRGSAAFAGAPQSRDWAFRRFLESGFPTTRDEEWKFTSVAPIASMAFVRAEPAHPTARDLAPLAWHDGPTVVLVNGVVAPALSSLDKLPAGLTVTTNSASDGNASMGAFADLNAAFFEHRVVVTVAAKAVVREPLHVLWVSMPGAQPSIVAPRVALVVGEAADCTVVEDYATIGDGTMLTTAVTDVIVSPAAIVRHVKIQRESASAFHLATMYAQLGRASRLTSHALTFGGRIARNDIRAYLAGEGAECTLNGLYVAGAHALVDTHTTIEHRAPHCPSHEVYKGILGGHARAVFNGKIIVDQIAQKTDAKQTNKALLLSDDAQVNTKPQLEIFADDVKCTHGAAIGQLDDEALFYLRAHGIAERAARHMLIEAFAGEVLDGIAALPVRERARGWLHDALARVARD
jgi:Fe-S cluster assembly protein SufD